MGRTNTNIDGAFHMKPKAPQLAVIILYFSGVPAHIKSQSEPINFAEFSFKLFGSIFSNFIMESFGRPAPLSTDKAENNARAPSDFERFFDFISTDLIRSKIIKFRLLHALFSKNAALYLQFHGIHSFPTIFLIYCATQISAKT